MTSPDVGVTREAAVPQGPVGPAVEPLAVSSPNGEVGLGPDPSQAPNSPAAPDETGAAPGLSRLERQRGRYILGLYKRLREIPEVPLPPKTVNRLISRLPGWEHTIEGVDPEIHYLTRQALHASVKLRLPEPSPLRDISRAINSLTIKVEDDHVRGRDLLSLLMVESQYPRHLLRREMKAKENERPTPPPPTGLAIKFRETKGIYLQEGDVFTDTQTVVLSGMTRNSFQGELADDLGIKSEELGELLKGLCVQAGIPSRRGSSDSYIELMLVAMALEVANTDHVPKSRQANIDNFKPDERELLTKYYSPDPDERAAVRADRSKNALSLVWSRIYKKIGTEGPHSRYEAVLYAVKNDMLRLPDASTLKGPMSQPIQASKAAKR